MATPEELNEQYEQAVAAGDIHGVVEALNALVDEMLAAYRRAIGQPEPGGVDDNE